MPYLNLLTDVRVHTCKQDLATDPEREMSQCRTGRVINIFALNECTLQLQAWNRAPPEAAGSFSGSIFWRMHDAFGVEITFWISQWYRSEQNSWMWMRKLCETARVRSPFILWKQFTLPPPLLYTL